MEELVVIRSSSRQTTTAIVDRVLHLFSQARSGQSVNVSLTADLKAAEKLILIYNRIIAAIQATLPQLTVLKDQSLQSVTQKKDLTVDDAHTTPKPFLLCQSAATGISDHRIKPATKPTTNPPTLHRLSTTTTTTSNNPNIALTDRRRHLGLIARITLER